jgi:hypothetical protein
MILIELITVWILRRLLIIVYVLFFPARMRLMPLFRLSQAQRRPSYALLKLGVQMATNWAHTARAKGRLQIYAQLWYGMVFGNALVLAP